MLKIIFALAPLFITRRPAKLPMPLEKTADVPGTLELVSLRPTIYGHIPYQHYYRHAFLSAGRMGL